MGEMGKGVGMGLVVVAWDWGFRREGISPATAPSHPVHLNSNLPHPSPPRHPAPAPATHTHLIRSTHPPPTGTTSNNIDIDNQNVELHNNHCILDHLPSYDPVHRHWEDHVRLRNWALAHSCPQMVPWDITHLSIRLGNGLGRYSVKPCLKW